MDSSEESESQDAYLARTRAVLWSFACSASQEDLVPRPLLLGALAAHLGCAHVLGRDPNRPLCVQGADMFVCVCVLLCVCVCVCVGECVCVLNM